MRTRVVEVNAYVLGDAARTASAELVVPPDCTWEAAQLIGHQVARVLAGAWGVHVVETQVSVAIVDAERQVVRFADLKVPV